MDFTEVTVASTAKKRREGDGCGNVSGLSSGVGAVSEFAACSTRDARRTLARSCVGTEAEPRAGNVGGLGSSFLFVPLRFRLAQPGRKRPKTSRAMRFTDRRFSSSSRDMSERM